MKKIGLMIMLFGILSISAHATLVNFDFTFTDSTVDPPDGEVSGTVTGELLGLQDNGQSDPLDVIIFSAPVGLGLTTPYHLGPGGFEGQGSNNGFIVSDETILSGLTTTNTGGGRTQLSVLYLDDIPNRINNDLGPDIGSDLVSTLGTANSQESTQNAEEPATFTYAGLYEAAVPEPSSLALFLMALSGLLFFRVVRSRFPLA